jgi:hypothetical protein
MNTKRKRKKISGKINHSKARFMFRDGNNVGAVLFEGESFSLLHKADGIKRVGLSSDAPVITAFLSAFNRGKVMKVSDGKQKPTISTKKVNFPPANISIHPKRENSDTENVSLQQSTQCSRLGNHACFFFTLKKAIKAIFSLNFFR